VQAAIQGILALNWLCFFIFLPATEATEGSEK